MKTEPIDTMYGRHMMPPFLSPFNVLNTVRPWSFPYESITFHRAARIKKIDIPEYFVTLHPSITCLHIEERCFQIFSSPYM
jgi:hypothetical protein